MSFDSRSFVSLFAESRLACTTPRRVDQPFPWVPHIPLAFFLVETLRPRLVVELGTHSGNSYNAFCQAVQLSGAACACYAVDTWKGDAHSLEYDDSVFDALAAHQQEWYSGFSTLLRMRFDEALPRFGDGTIDLLHIDGLHTYDAVRHDFDSWLPKMSARGVILLHDITVRHHDFGVWQLWEELQQAYPTAAFLHDYGLGVVIPGAQSSPELAQLRDALASPEASTVFACLGRAALLDAERSHAQARLQTVAQQLSQLQAEHAAVLDVVRARAARNAQTLATLRAALEAPVRAELEAPLRDLDTLRQRLQATQHDHDTTRLALAEAHQQLERAQQALDTSRSTIADLVAQLQFTAHTLRAVEGSRSWRLTAPYRRVASALRLRRIAR